MALPIYKDEKPDLAALTQLDMEAKSRGQRILFTVEDAAKDFFDFYDRFLTKPLAQDLDAGAEGEKLARYFELEELDRISDVRVHGKETEETERRIAMQLLRRLRRVTLEMILEDINETLAHHYEYSIVKANAKDAYNFRSKYVELSTHSAGRSEKTVTALLTPSRGRDVVRASYPGAYFPMYYVQKSPQRILPLAHFYHAK